MPVRPIAIGRPQPLKSLRHSVLSLGVGLAFGLAAGILPPLVRPISAQAVADLQVSPQAVTVGVGQKQTLFVAAFDRQGNVLPTARFAFASSDTTIASVNGDGVVVGLRAGLARVDVLAQSQKVAVAVFVTAPGGTPVDTGTDTRAGRRPDARADTRATARTDTRADAAAALRLDPPALTLLPGEAARITGTPLHPDGSSAAAVPLTWRSLRPSIATVSVDGTVNGVAPGEAVVQATGRGGLAATAAVTVQAAAAALSSTSLIRPPDALDTLYATVPSQGGRLLGGGLSWHAADTTIARVGPTGIVQTLAAGETDIIASGVGQELRAHVTVYRRPEILVLAPRPAAGAVVVPMGGGSVLGVRPLAADSTPVPQAPITWEVGDTTIATLDRATGRVTGRSLGTTSVTARVAGFEPALWVVTVVSGDIALNHGRLGLAAGEHQVLVPSYADSAAGPLNGIRFDWTTDHPGVATVSPDGTVTGGAPGRAVVTAWAPWGRTASATVFVTGDFLVSSNRGGRGFAIYQARLSAPDSLLRVLADTAANVQAVWSPDRTRIAFSSNRAGNYDLYVMDADGTNVEPLAPAAGTDGEPVWSPDGRRIVFSSARGGTPQLYSVAADGSDLRPLTAAAGASGSPAFSPNGQSIAFTSSRDGNYDVYLMDADGGNQRRITTTPGRELAPRFLPNGDLAWVVDRGARAGSAIVRQDGASVAVLAAVPAAIVSWSLSRDGRTLAYVTGRIGSARGATELSLVLQPLSGGPGIPVRLGNLEQPVTPAF